jgi:hypothetical protein
VQPWWIEAFVRPIAEGRAEYVSPLYRRAWYRVVTARNVSRAFLYAWFGTDLQHPLSGNAAIARPLLLRLAAREWTEAQLGYGVETVVAAALLGDGRRWATAQFDVCKDADRRFGHRKQIIRDVLTATVEAAREFAPRPGPGGTVETSPMTFLGGPAPETAWLDEGLAPALDRTGGCWRDYARWASGRIGELEAAVRAGRLDSALWFDVFARALLEARGDGRARPAAAYAASLAPLVSLRALTVWRDIAPMQASEVDANAAAEVPEMRSALECAAGWIGQHDADAAPRYERRRSAAS